MFNEELVQTSNFMSKSNLVVNDESRISLLFYVTHQRLMFRSCHGDIIQNTQGYFGHIWCSICQQLPSCVLRRDILFCVRCV